MIQKSMMGDATSVDELIAKFREELACALPEPDVGLDIDELMRRLNGELGIEDPTPHPSHSLPTWIPAQPDLPTRKEYSLHELLQFDDARFVETAYRVLMRRLPDPAGRDYYLRCLHNGTLSRIGVLAALRWSPEGMSRGIHVDGLLFPHLLERCQRWPVIGPVISWVRGFARLHTVSARHEMLRAMQARELQGLGEAHNKLVSLASDQLHQLHASCDAHARMLLQSGKELEAMTREVMQLRQTLATNESHWNARGVAFDDALVVLKSRQESAELELRDTQADILSRFGEQGAQLAVERARIDLAEIRHNDVAGVIDHVQRMWREQIETETARVEQVERMRREKIEAEVARVEAFAPLYARFEDRFRGKREAISKRMEDYLDVVRQPGIGDAEAPVVDVGSGRGEWLEVLRQAGMHAFGIDANVTFVADCRERGLTVSQGDAVQVLKSLPDASAGAVTSMHLVEHLPFDVLVDMVDQAQRVLRPGGLLLLETPNPENVDVGSHWFYLDPTHRNPLPPALLAWLVEDRGFERVEVRRLSVHRDFFPPEPLAEDIPGAAQLNALLARYSAAPDYAVVAWRR